MKPLINKAIASASTALPLIRKKNILVTGSHRTGTTLLGVLFAESPCFSFVYEPFNPDYGTNLKDFVCEDCGHKIDTWFVGVNSKNHKVWHRHMKHLVNSRALRGKRSIIKDPFAYFSAEWLQKEFSTDVLAMIRNPRSFVSSIKKMDWPFDFNNLLKQGWLMDGYLSEYKLAIEQQAKKQGDIIDQGILLWNLFNQYTYEMKNKHPEWVILKLEDFNMQPMVEFEKLCKQFEVVITQEMRDKVVDMTSANNPVESKKEIIHSLNRNSKEQNDIWKGRLTDEESERIQIGTEKVRGYFGY
jgi:hypothetical protein